MVLSGRRKVALEVGERGDCHNPEKGGQIRRGRGDEECLCDVTHLFTAEEWQCSVLVRKEDLQCHLPVVKGRPANKGMADFLPAPSIVLLWYNLHTANGTYLKFSFLSFNTPVKP